MSFPDYYKIPTMNYFSFVSLSFAYYVIFWAKIDIVEGIAGGEVARPGQFNYNVALYKDDSYICGAVPLTKQHVLTAAQCVMGVDNEFLDGGFWIIVGATTVDSSLYQRRNDVVYIYVPTEFRFPDIHGYRSPKAKDIVGDIAVLKLGDRVDINESVLSQLVWGTEKLLSRHDVSIYQSEAVIAGYGHETVTKVTDSAGQQYIQYESSAIRLKYAKTNTLTPTECRNLYMNKRNSLCARVIQRHSSVAEGTCKSDEGSPLIMHDRFLIGILVKPTIDCNESQTAALYTKVSDYYVFITTAIHGGRSMHIHGHAPREPKLNPKKTTNLVHQFSKLKILM